MLAEVCNLLVLPLELLDAWLLLSKALLPLLKKVDYGELFGVGTDLAFLNQLVIDFKYAVSWFNRIKVDVCEGAIGLLLHQLLPEEERWSSAEKGGFAGREADLPLQPREEQPLHHHLKPALCLALVQDTCVVFFNSNLNS